MTNRRMGRWAVAAAATFIGIAFVAAPGWAQSAGTGALAGTILDSSGAVVPGVKVTVRSKSTGEMRITTSSSAGYYRVAVLPPGAYDVQVEKAGFKTDVQTGVSVVVTQITTLDIKLQIGTTQQSVTVTAEATLEQTESSSLGRAVNENDINNLPLVNRNYQQILTLSPGIAAEVPDATQLGNGSGLAIYAHGGRSSDNSFEMNGVDVNDLLFGGTSRVPIPNPDTIQEFKVQTGQYDAAYGRDAGSNVQLVTKTGTNAFHGDAFEYFRNAVLDANSFFGNEAGQPRPVLNQNQFGGTLGGPVKKDKLFFFGSYQGTRQINGASTGCESDVILPLLSNDRSALAIANLFAGQRGAIQNAIGAHTPFPVGPAVNPNAPNGAPGPGPGPFAGSDHNPYNVNPVALALLNLKLPDGNFYIPNPQVTTGPNAGLSVFSNPCRFNEDQYVADVDYLPTAKSRLSVKYFIANDNQTTFFNNSGITTSQILPGSPASGIDRTQNASVAYAYAFNSQLLNEVRFGYGRYHDATLQQNPFTYSSIGVTAPGQVNDLPTINIPGCCQLGGAGDETDIQNSVTVNDSLSYIHGRHNFSFGGGFTHYETNIRNFRFNGIQEYLTWPDFLLGLNGAQNATANFAPPGFSNAIVSIAFVGLPDRNWRTLDANSYGQDDIRVTANLTVNVGVRYEHLGDIGDQLGRNANFYPSLANPNPPAAGSLAGWIVPSNFRGVIPAGVGQLHNEFGVNGDAQNKWAPRVGFAWQILPHSLGVVLRGGYGIYYSRTVANATFQLETTPPFSFLSVCSATCNTHATEANPFPASTLAPLSSFPMFPVYSPTTTLTLITLAPDYQPPMVQQYSLGIQKAFAHDFLLDISYVGNHGTNLVDTLGQNQALNATTANPVRGQTSNTVANVRQRLPFLGFAAGPQGIDQLGNRSWSWYNGVDASLTKRFSRGLQFLASYTFARDLDAGGANPDAGSTGLDTTGDQNPVSQYGVANFERDQRFVLSFVYQLPGPTKMGSAMTHLLGGWGASSVMTFQSGEHLTLTNSNPNSAFAITSDHIALAHGCTAGMLVNPGSVESKLNNYFNASCVGAYPVIGSDGIATGLGNGGVGNVVGPGQNNIDFSLSKMTKLRESVSLEFRASFFNLFNRPNFGNPDTAASDATFGRITATTVNPRIGQLALKLSF
ncbi:MAG TPA: TonB-dependent receptor [Candidatus Acidoferrales bacterium]|nr:TonB-dependent receptor [Candidatus Acidoferrales bacterium]